MIAVRNYEDPQELYGRLYDANPNALVCKGFETAYLGFTVGAMCVAVYDYDMCIDLILAEGDLTKEEAVTYFYYTTLSKCATAHSPIFMRNP